MNPFLKSYSLFFYTHPYTHKHTYTHTHNSSKKGNMIRSFNIFPFLIQRSPLKKIPKAEKGLSLIFIM